MPSPTAVMADLPHELLLEMAEVMDMKTTMSFLETNKGIAATLQAYERSICKTKASTFLLTPAGNVLSSSGPDRRVFKEGTFKSIYELELRESRINEILYRSMFFDISGPYGLDPLTTMEQRRLTQLLKKAIYQCDHMADIAANTKQGAAPAESYDAIFTGVWAQSNLPETVRNLDPFTNIHARAEQIEFIKSLPLEDLAVLFYFITLAGLSFVSFRKYQADDPVVWEKITVFEECLLRHGSWFLWSHIKGTDMMKTMAGNMMQAGLVELIDWETGKEGMADGLRMSLIEAARTKLQAEVDDEDDVNIDANGITLTMMKKVSKIIEGGGGA